MTTVEEFINQKVQPEHREIVDRMRKLMCEVAPIAQGSWEKIEARKNQERPRDEPGSARILHQAGFGTGRKIRMQIS